MNPTEHKTGRQNSGAIRLSWRYACPFGHQGLRRRSAGFRCQSCECIYAEAFDRKTDRAVKIEDIR